MISITITPPLIIFSIEKKDDSLHLPLTEVPHQVKED